jgi:predicted PurR-regulated permease PerM
MAETDPFLSATNFRRNFLILLVIVVSIAFIGMIQIFLMTVLLAALFTGVAYPVQRGLTQILRGKKRIAAVATLLLLLILVIGPLLLVAGAVANEARRVNDTLLPALQQMVNEPGELESRLRPLPGYHLIEPYRAQIITKASELIGGAGVFVFNALSATTRATVVFFFHFVVMLYTMFFFLTDGPRLVQSLMAYLPLGDTDKERMLTQFVSVTRATLKGTVLIGAAQGFLGGVVFWIVGIDGAIFWGTVMTVLSIIPGIGGALVWVPAAIILLAMGNVWQAILLCVLCGLVIGSVDNLLRPILVGRDTQMHELLIFFSTLGGLLMFGAMGFILGPILAALFLTVWDMFRTMFRVELVATPSATIVTTDTKIE